MIKPPTICAITKVDDPNLIDNVISVLDSGIRWIQYRQKSKTRRQMYEEAIKIRGITMQYNAILTVNDHIDIALAVRADSVHLGQEDIPLSEAKKIIPKDIKIGISTHNIDEVRLAVLGGADYIGFGPIFETTTKDAGQPKGAESLMKICQMVDIPVVAIGGINIHNIGDLTDITGLYAVAISSGIFDGDVKRNSKNLYNTISNRREGLR